MISEAYSNNQNGSGYIRNDNYVKVVEKNHKQIPMILDSLETEIKLLGESLEQLFGQLQCCSTIMSSPKPDEIEDHNIFCSVANRIKDASYNINKFRVLINNQCDTLQL